MIIYDYVLSSETYQTRELGFHEIEFVCMYSPLRHWQTRTNPILTKTTDSLSFTPDYRWGHICALVIYLHLDRRKIPAAVVLSRDRHMIKMIIIWGQDKNYRSRNIDNLAKCMWHWLYRTNRSLSSTLNYLKYINVLSVENKRERNFSFMIHRMNSVWQGLINRFQETIE